MHDFCSFPKLDRAPSVKMARRKACPTIPTRRDSLRKTGYRETFVAVVRAGRSRRLPRRKRNSDPKVAASEVFNGRFGGLHQTVVLPFFLFFVLRPEAQSGGNEALPL